MQIKLWKNFSKRRNSTKLPADADAVVVNVNLKENTSIENPTFLLNAVDFEYNYAYAFGHFYFINDITLITKDVYEIRCEQDILATYKGQISNVVAKVQYSSSDYDLNIKDLRLDSSESISTSYVMDTSAMFSDTGCYVVGIMNTQADGNNGALSLYAMNSDELLDLVSTLNAQDWWNGIELGLENVLVSPMEFITFCKWVPFTKAQIPGVNNLPVYAGYKFLNFTSRSIGRPLVIDEYTFSVPSRFTSHNFTDLEPYTTYSLYLPFVGNVNFDYEAYYPASSVTIKVVADVSTGDISYTLSKDGIHPIQTFSGKCSVDYPMSASKSDGLGVASGILSTIGSATRAMAGDVVGGTIGVASGFSQIASSLHLQSMINGGLSSRTSVAQSMQITLTILRKGLPDALSNDRLAKMGLPCCKVRSLSGLSGFCQCVDASIDLGGLAGDRDAINSFLNGGFYLE